MTQAVFFDLDETLIRHSTPVMEQLQKVSHDHLADLSAPRWETFQQHLLTNVGQLWSNIAAHQGQCETQFVAIFRDSLERAGCAGNLAESMIEAFLTSVVESTGPNEGALEVLDQLAAAGIATGIITNGFSFLQTRKTRAHGLTERVQFVLTSEDAGAHKPDARIFRMALEKAGAAAGAAWHVGDHRENDIGGAIGAGLRGVLYDPERLLADAAMMNPPPTRVISSLLEIPALIAVARR